MILITITEFQSKPHVKAIDVDNNYEWVTYKMFDTVQDAKVAAEMLRDVFQYCCGHTVVIENKMAPSVYVG